MRLRRPRGRTADLLLALVPFLLYLALNVPLLWKQDFFAFHDTLQLFELFHIAYGSILLDGTMAEWVPYGNYGMPAYVKDIIGFSPLTYVAFAFGALGGVRDSWPLFLGGLAAEVLLFAIGIHAFCRLFLSRFASSLVVGASFLLTSTPWWNYPFNFRVVYLVPAASWLLVRFFRTGHVSALALSGTLILLSGFGEPQYIVLMLIFYWVTVGIAFGAAYRRGFRPKLDRGAVALVPLAGAFGVATVYLFLSSIQGFTFVTRDRMPDDLRVDLGTFLRYGGGGIEKLVELVAAVPFGTLDVQFHITGPALVLAIYGCFRERSRDFLAIAGAFLVLLVFCFGPYSPVAYLVYFVPGMAYFRHVGLMYAFPRLLLAVMAGFGADRFLAALADGDRNERGRSARVEVALLALLLGGAAGFVTVLHGFRSVNLAIAGASLVSFLAMAVIALYASSRGLPAMLVALIVAEGAVYLTGFTVVAHRPNGVDGAITVVTERAFEEQRPVVLDDHPRAGPFLGVATRGILYTEANTFIELDSCTPIGRVDGFAKSIGDLARNRFGSTAVLQFLGTIRASLPDDPFFQILGCYAAKLQLVEAFAEQPLADGAEAPPVGGRQILVESPAGERRLVVPANGRPAAATLAEQNLMVTGHSTNHVAVRMAVSRPDGAWLVYADAYHPWWRADIDGAPTTVWRADLAVKAVRVPHGEHTVTFRFGNRFRQAVVWTVGLGGALLILAVTSRMAWRPVDAA
jgi:hypothetical protein